jgi:Family of unknown function (DUF6114)/zinc-ribbon domain
MGASGYPPPPYAPYATTGTEPRPTTAFALALAGGVLILLAGLVELWIGYLTTAILFSSGFSAFFVLLGVVGIVLGALIILLGVLLLQHPEHHTVFGVLILVLSLLSVASYWGFLIGLVLGVVAGVLAISWNPVRAMPPPYYPGAPGGWPTMAAPSPPPFQRVCLRCGRVVPIDVRFCPHCGNPLPA